MALSLDEIKELIVFADSQGVAHLRHGELEFQFHVRKFDPEPDDTTDAVRRAVEKESKFLDSYEYPIGF